MKVSLIRILREDLARSGELPAWIDTLLGPLNTMIDYLGRAMNNNLSLKDNVACLEVFQSLTHGTESIINPRTTNRVLGITIVDTGGQMITGWQLTKKTTGNIGVTVNYAAGAGTKSTCLFYVLYG